MLGKEEKLSFHFKCNIPLSPKPQNSFRSSLSNPGKKRSISSSALSQTSLHGNAPRVLSTGQPVLKKIKLSQSTVLSSSIADDNEEALSPPPASMPPLSAGDSPIVTVAITASLPSCPPPHPVNLPANSSPLLKAAEQARPAAAALDAASTVRVRTPKRSTSAQWFETKRPSQPTNHPKSQVTAAVVPWTSRRATDPVAVKREKKMKRERKPTHIKSEQTSISSHFAPAAPEPKTRVRRNTSGADTTSGVSSASASFLPSRRDACAAPRKGSLMAAVRKAEQAKQRRLAKESKKKRQELNHPPQPVVPMTEEEKTKAAKLKRGAEILALRYKEKQERARRRRRQGSDEEEDEQSEPEESQAVPRKKKQIVVSKAIPLPECSHSSFFSTRGPSVSPVMATGSSLMTGVTRRGPLSVALMSETNSGQLGKLSADVWRNQLLQYLDVASLLKVGRLNWACRTEILREETWSCRSALKLTETSPILDRVRDLISRYSVSRLRHVTFQTSGRKTLFALHTDDFIGLLSASGGRNLLEMLETFELHKSHDLTDRGMRVLAYNCKHLRTLHIPYCSKFRSAELQLLLVNCGDSLKTLNVAGIISSLVKATLHPPPLPICICTCL